MNVSAMRVLVVDDHAPIRLLLRTLLFGLGFKEISDADDAATALEILRLGRTDLVILDQAMPVFTGLELVKMIRTAADSPARATPIIMVTGHATRALALEAKGAGVSAFLVKPLTAKALARAVEFAILGDGGKALD